MENKSVAYIAMEQGVLQELQDELVEDEYENILEEGWLCNGTVEGEVFKTFSDEMKKVFALQSAVAYANKMLMLSESDFVRNIGDIRFDHIIKLSLK